MTNQVNLKEWDRIVIKDLELPDDNTRDIARELTDKKIIEVMELKEGLSIRSNSYVGRIKLGNLQINVEPKIGGLPLYQLLRYAYSLRNLNLFNEAEHTLQHFSFFDLLIYELYIEAEDLLRRGIQKTYIEKKEDLSSPRGRIDMNKLCGQGGIVNDTLPCRYFVRNENNKLNQTLLAGLILGLRLVVDTGLANKVRRLCSTLEENISNITLTRSSLQVARNHINRLTGRYSAVLEIINILFESQGIQLEDGSSHRNLHGYFFDMNAFFETLVGLLLKCSRKYSIKDQYSIHDMFIYTPTFNPRNRGTRTPRPDFALMNQGKVIYLFDAKYRDLWENSLPADMLYQLAIYAVSGIGNKTATILYPSTDDIPTLQKIDIHDPISNSKMATITLKPINLIKVAKLVSDEKNSLASYVDRLIVEEK